ncbi:MAG TPA: ABC transporter permease subunit [Candidatus Eisenbergiella merdavium]|uniref:ABC transporter permease subunit n=1 Tax=Candidatus Eisenbergiella merdavium TaxID=2838551 RepID=A0A9D2SP12_9FIRM|nr:ABC transporter permease subunit [Candidatus Eisenbergiella merdavium]
MVQTVSYLPNFISWVLMYTIANAFLNTNTGIINQIIVNLGLSDTEIPFLTAPEYFYGVSVFLAMWKNSGYWAIIFLAAISGIDPQLYEAADIDGAGRLAKIWHITLPGIKASVVTVLILSIGSLLGGGMGGSNFEQAYIFGNTFNNSASEILQTYSFKTGLSNGRFAYATAVDLFQSVISVLLILISNFGAKKITGEGIF